MLYVFQVDTGTMMTFDMRLAMESVTNLKTAIAAKTDIPGEKQVLLISGGESLDNTQRVCSYSSAGTDTSPIFLFAKVNIESNQPPLPSEDYGDDTDLMESIESCMSMQPSLDTLVARTELAAALNDHAISHRDNCERLVHDQHLQQQGWAAVTANLEDLTRAFKNKSDVLMSAFSEFTKCKDNYKELLNEFGDDIKRLHNMPVLPKLLEGHKLQNVPSTSSSQSADAKVPKPTATIEKSSDEKLESSDKEAHQRESMDEKSLDGEQKQQQYVDEDNLKSRNMEEATEEKALKSEKEAKKVARQETSNTGDDISISLRQWIDFHDSNNRLEKMIELCWRGLERFTQANADQIRQEVQELLNSANTPSMKEIKGLEERLFGLEKLMVDAKKVVEEQSQLASSFQSNKERFSKIKDCTLLPDLSASHKQQLQMMLANHKKMSDYRCRCLKAKQELSVNLHARLKWIMFIEQQICNLDGKLMIYKENLTRLNRHFEIVKQVHKAPDLYLASVVETLRRRQFSRRYLHWANSVAKISQELYNDEMQARKEFDEKLGTHFISTLFPGLARSYPPPFATKQPDPFDTKLPRITARDIQYLQANLSEDLAKNLHIPKKVPLPHIVNASTINLNEGGDQIDETEDLDDRNSLNPTPPSSPTRQQ